MIRTPPEHNTENPPGQIKYPPKQGLYLRDIISRIQREEEQAANRAYGKELARRSSEDRGLPTPLAGPEKALNDLVGALLAYCRDARERATPQERIFIEDIRKIISKSR